MNPAHDWQSHDLPSKQKLAKAMVLALAAAAAMLVTIVLPAEYGVDPVGTGAALGLLRLTAPALPLQEFAAPAGAPSLTPVQSGPVARYASEFKFDSTEFSLGPYEYVEYKYRLEKGASLLYSWTASAPVVQDFHAEPDGAQRGYAESFEKGTMRQAYGAFTAPFSGIHGWYWENPGGSEINVKLTSAGFYAFALEILMDHTRHPHEATALGELTITRKTDRSPGALDAAVPKETSR